ncbi:MAG: type II toxin-antitoxin system CcdA family antitoxin [Rhodocyclaceae bacterium]|nr:type II toxin-antitoxin system CcdA family antitoxin [Rhodocyclaceae bacterium]MCL4683057.1 type II toxin-antitoxin system CcdA family antitoxin [Rhodocyclaceae bacterium]
MPPAYNARARKQALDEALRKKLREQWLSENKAAMQAYNAHVEQHGVFSDGLRSF